MEPMQCTKVKDIMTPHPTLISPEATIQEAAKKMQEIDCGVLPVGTEENVEGMITDRDIVVRVIAEGEDPNKKTVRDYMTQETFSCKEDASLQDAADQMRRHHVGRLLVHDNDNKICGILSLGGILRKDEDTNELMDVIEHVVGTKKSA